jgi:hypothetical protein
MVHFHLGSQVANVQDIVLTIGFMWITQFVFVLTSIAALLTILGYSLNDTVVIYDRIREMLRRYRKLPMPDLLNASVNQTLSRSVITHVTVSLALLALLLFGGQAIHSFTATMMFGVVPSAPIRRCLLLAHPGLSRRRNCRATARQIVTSRWSSAAAPTHRTCRALRRSMRRWRFRLPECPTVVRCCMPDGIWARPVKDDRTDRTALSAVLIALKARLFSLAQAELWRCLTSCEAFS